MWKQFNGETNAFYFATHKSKRNNTRLKKIRRPVTILLNCNIAANDFLLRPTATALLTRRTILGRKFNGLLNYDTDCMKPMLIFTNFASTK